MLSRNDRNDRDDSHEVPEVLPRCPAKLAALLAVAPLNAFGIGPEGQDGQCLAPLASPGAELSGAQQSKPRVSICEFRYKL